MKSLLLWQHAQDLHTIFKFKPDKIPAGKRWGKYDIPPLIVELFPFGCCWKRGSQFSAVFYYLVYRPHSSASLTPRSSQPTQMDLMSSRDRDRNSLEHAPETGGWEWRSIWGRGINIIRKHCMKISKKNNSLKEGKGGTRREWKKGNLIIGLHRSQWSFLVLTF